VKAGFAEQKTERDDLLDARQIATNSLPEKPFPAGRIFRACFQPEAHSAIWQHALGTLADGDQIKEVGGFLIGDVFRDEAGPYLEIKAAIRGEHTRNEGTEVAFTPETWANLNAEKDKHYPADRIVGWYHTHPRFGIFLSDRDQFVHRHSFPQPWATAFVVDPVDKLEGLFAWAEDEPRRMPEYWVGPERKLFVENTVRTEEPRQPNDPRTAARNLHWGLTIGAALAFLGLLVAFGLFYYRSSMAWADERQLIVQALNSERQDLDRAAQILAELRGRIESVDQRAKQVDERAKQEDQRLRGEIKSVESSLRQVTKLNRALQQRIEGARAANPEERGKQ
jgi:proteasome lid subunit RPN8/RPN11/F0F1-type ATP synthase membrane subunit b/b'